MKKSAIISDCGKYRYELHRTWDEDKGKVLFIMLNPSTADGIHADLTTTRCINFAKKWEYGGIMIGNIYPFRAKRPKDLKKWLETSMNPMALNENMKHVREMAKQTDLIVCAWGCNFPYMPNWVEELGDLFYLELCKDNITPKHPLGNISKDEIPTSYNLNTIVFG